MSSISGIGSSSSSWAAMQDMRGLHKAKQANLNEMASQAFSALDGGGKGYIDKADLQGLNISSTSQSSDGSSGVDKLFSALDADGSGQVTKEEFTDSLQKIADQLDQQRQSSKMQDAIAQAGLNGQQGPGGAQGQGGGMPPPPPPEGGDAGMTKDQMSSKLSEVGSSDSQLSSLLTNTLKNFEAADTNQDGKVSAQEALAYQKKSSESSTSSETQAQTQTDQGTSSSANPASGTTSAQVARQVAQLFQAYMGSQIAAAGGSIAVSA